MWFLSLQGEVELVQRMSREAGAFDAVICDHYAKGGEMV